MNCYNSPYISLLDKFIDLYSQIKPIYTIYFNEALSNENFEIIQKNKLILDTIDLLDSFGLNSLLQPYIFDNINLYNNDINLIDFNNKEKENNKGNNNNIGSRYCDYSIYNDDNNIIISNNIDFNNNLFIKYTKQFEELEKDKSIYEIKDNNNNNNCKILKNLKNLSKKKEHEINRLYQFIKENIETETTFLEVGCGKSYLTESLIAYKIERNITNFKYIGIDMNEKLIDNCKLKFGKLEKQILTKISAKSIKNNIKYENEEDNINYINNINNINKNDNNINNEINKIFLKKVKVNDDKNNNNNPNKTTYIYESKDLSFYSLFISPSSIYTLNNILEANNNNNDLTSNMNQTQLTSKTLKNKKLPSSTFIFGLHSCGNLASTVLSWFSSSNKEPGTIGLVGCCLHKLTERKELHILNMGKDKKDGNLELKKDNEINENIFYGYPMCEYLKDKYKYFHLSQNVRSSSMTNHTENNIKTKEQWRKNYFRCLAHAYLKKYPLVSQLLRVKNIKLSSNMNFSSYMKAILNNIENKIKDMKLKENDDLSLLCSEFETLKKEENTNQFFEKSKHKEKILFAFNAIMVKFSKIIEYIISLDRVIFLLEKGIENVKLIKIFDNKISPRNLLIYAKKN